MNILTLLGVTLIFFLFQFLIIVQEMEIPSSCRRLGLTISRNHVPVRGITRRPSLQGKHIGLEFYILLTFIHRDILYKFKRKESNLDQIWTSDFQISSLAFYHLSYRSWIWRYRSKFPSWKQSYAGVVVCDTTCHQFANKLTSYCLFFKIKSISKYKPIVFCLEELQFRFKTKIRTWTGIWISYILVYKLGGARDVERLKTGCNETF